jgi:uncharacterized heparinase superfamily protein
MPGLATYWNTVKYLRPVQLYGRLWFRVHRPSIDNSPAPTRRIQVGPWVTPAGRRPSIVGPRRARFLNDTRDILPDAWNESGVDRLWSYNLHYFDDLNALDASSRASWHRELLDAWVAENPPGVGVGWDPYPTSLRIVNWIKWAAGGNELSAECIESLACQTRWLSGRIERHLLGNHLFANAKALIFAGSFFQGHEADSWFAAGAKILAREIPEQILTDGGHFERSTMYHALAFEDALDLWNVSAAYGRGHSHFGPAHQWRETIGLMGHWLRVACHPDGEIAFFNDAAIGIAPAPSSLHDYADRLGIVSSAQSHPMTSLVASGYVRLESKHAVVVIDAAPVGPDYLPAHAHADTLSFELSLFGQRVFVNSGTSLYAAGQERSRQRGTAAHNTVEVDGMDSSEVWGSFRVARRARPVGLTLSDRVPPQVRCAHDGYRRLGMDAVHERTWTLASASLDVGDCVIGSFRTAIARFHLHPAIKAAVGARPDVVDLQLPAGENVRMMCDGGSVRLYPSNWHPEFGVSIPAMVVAVSVPATGLLTRISWSEAP